MKKYLKSLLAKLKAWLSRQGVRLRNSLRAVNTLFKNTVRISSRIVTDYCRTLSNRVTFWHRKKRVRSGGYSFFFGEVKGIGQDSGNKVDLKILKVIPSVLFLNSSEIRLYVEVEVYNPDSKATEPVMFSGLELDVFPLPPSPPECKSVLFADEDESWHSMFANYEPCGPNKTDKAFCYNLDLGHEKEKETETETVRKVCVTPCTFDNAIVTKEEDFAGTYNISSFKTFSSGHPSLKPLTDQDTSVINAIGFYLLFRYTLGPEFVDEASTIHHFDFGLKESNDKKLAGSNTDNLNDKTHIDYMGFFGVLPEKGIFVGSHSRINVHTYSPASVKKMFREWYELSKCDSTRSHRVIRANEEFASKHAYIEALISYPTRRFWKVFLSFLVAFIGSIFISLVMILATGTDVDVKTLLGGIFFVVVICAIAVWNIYRW